MSAQIRIWFDSDKSPVSMYNMPFVYRLHEGHNLSTTQLQYTLQLIVTKHLSLRTSLIFDQENNLLIQRIISSNNINTRLFTFIESTYETDEELNDIIYHEKFNSELFNLSQGLVFRCHFVYYKQISSNDLLTGKDVIIFNFHHALFDDQSMNIFLHDLDQTYTTNQLIIDDRVTLRYLDCEYKYFVFVIHFINFAFVYE